MANTLSPTERAYLSERYHLGGNGPEAAIDYAIKTAFAYADQHAAGAAPVIRDAIARAFIHFMLQADRGEKMLLMQAIDRLIDMGSACHAHRH